MTICVDLHRLLLCVFLVRHGQGRGDVSWVTSVTLRRPGARSQELSRKSRQPQVPGVSHVNSPDRDQGLGASDWSVSLCSGFSLVITSTLSGWHSVSFICARSAFIPGPSSPSFLTPEPEQHLASLPHSPCRVDLNCTFIMQLCSHKFDFLL